MIAKLWRALTGLPPEPRYVPYLPLRRFDCEARGPLPDPECTPGGTVPVALRDLCTPGYAAKARKVSASRKRGVAVAYHLTSVFRAEVDHLIPLELGGSNEVANLWPEFDYKAKDWIEGELHRLVCAGEMPLAEAQERIATDWTAALPDESH